MFNLLLTRLNSYNAVKVRSILASDLVFKEKMNDSHEKDVEKAVQHSMQPLQWRKRDLLMGFCSPECREAEEDWMDG